MSSPTVRPGRRTALVNGAIAVATILGLAAVSVVASPPAPPTVAEFAPQAQQQIEEAPDEQSAESGEGAAAAGAGQQEVITVVETTAEQEAAEVETTTVDEGVPSALTCVSWPDGSVTQTFDPQSPPCVATWGSESGNGGATSTGVTATDIRVAVPSFPEYSDQFDALFEHFNQSYQLYGRKLARVEVLRAGHSPEEQQSRAQGIGGEQVFAYLPTTDETQLPIFRSTLAGQGVISVGHNSPTRTTEEHQRLDPYLWSFGPTADQLGAHVGEFGCSSLAGRPAEWGAAEVRTLTRKFAILVGERSSNGKQGPDVSLAATRLESCAGDVAVVPFDIDGEQTQRTLALTQLRNDGVTTLAVAATGYETRTLRMDAQALGWQPEWLLFGLNGQYDDLIPRDQGMDQTFGLTSTNRYLSMTQDPSYIAMGASGREFDAIWTPRWMPPLYRELLVLASGIQAAGPDLTPASFAQSLRQLRFPNPGAASAPFWQASIGFADDNIMVNDVGVWWFDRTRTSMHSGVPGAGLCWLGGGSRWHLGSWASDLRLFEGTCR